MQRLISVLRVFLVKSDQGTDQADDIPAVIKAPASQLDDIWQLGRHRLLCGSALAPGAYHALMGEQRARLVFTDPPYNVRIQGHAAGKGRTRHREFAMASGNKWKRMNSFHS